MITPNYSGGSLPVEYWGNYSDPAAALWGLVRKSVAPVISMVSCRSDPYPLRLLVTMPNPTIEVLKY